MQSLNQTFTNKITLPKKSLSWKNWKASSELQVNYLLTLQICKPKLKSYVSKELLHKISTNLRTFCVCYFSQDPKNWLFANISQIGQKHLFRVQLFFANQPKKKSSSAQIISRKWQKFANSRRFLQCGKIPHSNLNM